MENTELVEIIKRIVADAIADSEARIITTISARIDAMAAAFTQSLGELYTELGASHGRLAQQRISDLTRLEDLERRIEKLERRQ